MKKVCLLHVLVFFFVSMVYSHSLAHAEAYIKQLEAQIGTEYIFDKVEIEILDNSTDIVKIYGTVDASSVAGYDLILDEHTNTYFATKLRDEDVAQSIKEIKAIEIQEGAGFLQEGVTSDSIESNVPTLSKADIWTYSVSAATVDFPGVPLCKTAHKLNWSRSGNKVKYHSRGEMYWAANPSLFGTHWYVKDHKYTAFGLTNNSRTVHSEMYASYYNYDFGDDKEITTVSHRITLNAHYDGKINYNVNWQRSGEARWLLRLHVLAM